MYIKRKSRLADKDKFFPVQIYDEAFEILTRLKARNVLKGPEDYVFVDNKGMQIGNIKKSFKNSLKECGIDKAFPMFSFRHQFATEMTARGVPPKALSEQMGHKSMRMIDETYTHLMREHHAIIAERIGVDNGKKPEAEKPEKLHWIFSPDLDRPLTDEEFEDLRKHMIESIINGQK
jgi:integrase